MLQSQDLCRSLWGQPGSQDSFWELGCRSRGQTASGRAVGVEQVGTRAQTDRYRKEKVGGTRRNRSGFGVGGGGHKGEREANV